jgi:leucyl/phenylalanyl-tRNA---protein transferase
MFSPEFHSGARGLRCQVANGRSSTAFGEDNDLSPSSEEEGAFWVPFNETWYKPANVHTFQPIDPQMLLLAYRGGIFPMADTRDDPEIFWVEPKMRAILPLDGFHCSHSLSRTLRRGTFRITCNAAFRQVMQACAAPRQSEGGESWISHRIEASYVALHRLGHAHSIECWQDGLLVGGLYGVGFDRVFCGESMFSRETDASKVALAWLVAALKRGGARLLDCQFITPHLASLGAVEIAQADYIDLLQEAQMPYSDVAEGFGDGLAAGDADGFGLGAALSLPDGFAALVADAAAAGASSSPGNFIAQSFTHTS